MNLLAYCDDGPAKSPISPLVEMGAYEALWLEKGASFKSIAAKFAADPEALPSDFVDRNMAENRASEVMAKLKNAGVHRFGDGNNGACYIVYRGDYRSGSGKIGHSSKTAEKIHPVC